MERIPKAEPGPAERPVRRRVRDIRPTSWLSVVLLASVVLGAWAWSQRIAQAEDALVAELTLGAARSVERVVSNEVQTLSDTLSRFCAIWNDGGAPVPSEWERSAGELRAWTAFEAVGWSPDGEALRYVSGSWDAVSAAAAARGFSLLFASEERLGRARVYGVGDTLWFGAPMRVDGVQGVVLAVVDGRELASRVPALSSGFRVSLESPSGASYALGDEVTEVAEAWRVALPMPLGGSRWQVWSTPSAQEVSRLKSPLPGLILVVGVLFGLLCSVVIRAMQLERKAAESARLATVQLRGSEAEVRTFNADLEQRVAERTAELEQSNRDLEQFATAASHDLQEPLRMVISYLQLLESRYGEALDETGKQFLHFAVDGGLRMRELVRGLLHYARVGRGRVEAVEVRLDDVLADVLSNLSVAIEESGAEVQVAPLPVIGGDHELLVQLFQNLVGNSLKYTQAAPRVRVSARTVVGGTVRGPSGEALEISVEDEGIGIASKDAERVFELFQRLHRRETYEGTGLGLAVCKRIAELHSGSIALDTSYAPGSRFVVTLPVVEVQAGSASRSALFRLAQSE